MALRLVTHRARHHVDRLGHTSPQQEGDQLAFAFHAHDGCGPLIDGLRGSLEGATHDVDMVGRNGYVSGSASTVGGHP